MTGRKRVLRKSPEEGGVISEGQAAGWGGPHRPCTRRAWSRLADPAFQLELSAQAPWTSTMCSAWASPPAGERTRRASGRQGSRIGNDKPPRRPRPRPGRRVRRPPAALMAPGDSPSFSSPFACRGLQNARRWSSVESGLPAIAARFSAAALMKVGPTSPGWETMATWLEGTSIVVAPIRLANMRSASGRDCLILRGGPGTRTGHQLPGRECPITSPKAEPARACPVRACITLAWTGCTSAAKYLTKFVLGQASRIPCLFGEQVPRARGAWGPLRQQAPSDSPASSAKAAIGTPGRSRFGASGPKPR